MAVRAHRAVLRFTAPPPPPHWFVTARVIRYCSVERGCFVGCGLLLRRIRAPPCDVITTSVGLLLGGRAPPFARAFWVPAWVLLRL